MILEEAGYVVREAVDGDDALRKLDEQPPDLIIIDLTMPGKGGIQTIKEIRRQNRCVKIVAMSGGRENFEASEFFGANYTVGKPFHCDAMVALAKTALGEDQTTS